MSKKSQLRIIQGGNSPGHYSHKELMENLDKHDEFTKYRTKKEINKVRDRLINELGNSLSEDNCEIEKYLEKIIQIHKKLSLDNKAYLYEFARGLLIGQEEK